MNKSFSIEQITKVVTHFYTKALLDEYLGYQFRKISNLKAHIDRVSQFWQLQLTGQIDDRTQLPFKLIHVHRNLNINKGELGRWLIMFKESLDSQLSDDNLKKLWLQRVEKFKARIELEIFGP